MTDEIIEPDVEDEEDDEFMKRFKAMSDEERIAWLENFAEKLPLYADELGVSEADVERVKSHLAHYKEAVEKERIAHREAKIAEMNYQQSLVELDDALFDAMERTGKPISLPVEKTPKKFDSH